MIAYVGELLIDSLGNYAIALSDVPNRPEMTQRTVVSKVGDRFQFLDVTGRAYWRYLHLTQEMQHIFSASVTAIDEIRDRGTIK